MSLARHFGGLLGDLFRSVPRSAEEGDLRSVTITLTISERSGSGVRVRGPDAIYVAGDDKDAVFRDLGPVIQTILSHNYGYKWVLNDEGAAK